MGLAALLNRAFEPIPSELPMIPGDPAIVLTTQFVPTGATLRMVEFWKSATTRLPALSSATPQGWLNEAALLVPSAAPMFVGEPANVVTIPFRLTFRTVLFHSS